MIPPSVARAAVLSILLLPSLAAAQRAEILWDNSGVPHIYAGSDFDVHYGFGWAQMHLHGNALLRLYGLASGRAAEFWGEEHIETDQLHHAIGMPGMVRAIQDDMEKEVRLAVEAFVEGMNAYASAHPERLADSLRVVLPLAFEDVGNRVSAAMLLFSSAPQVRQRWLRAQADLSLGSNAWAVNGPLSASGNAMLLANPHLPFWDELRWVEARLSSPEADVYGATLLGFPVIAIGFTERHGWTHTVNTQDHEDFYDLTVVDEGYLFDGEVRSFVADTVTIRVRMHDGTLREVQHVTLASTHGPIIGTGEGKALARRGIVNGDPVSQWWHMTRATSLEEFEDALRRQALIGFTTTYADQDGNILHHYGAATPRRPIGDRAYWQGVVPGSSSDNLWHELYTYEELPGVVNPPSGWVQNANEASYWATFPLQFDLDDFAGYMGPHEVHFRAQRSIELLRTAAPLTFDAFDDLRRDLGLQTAERILPDLIEAARVSESEMAVRAADVLEAWDRTVAADSRGSVLFRAWYMTMAQQGGIFAIPWSAEDPLETPRGLADPAAAVATLEAVAQQVEAQAGALDVPWGAVNRFRYLDHDVPASGASGGLGAFRVLSFQPGDDGLWTAVHGDSYVMIVEFADVPRARALLVYGNATQAGSPFRGDQVEMGARGDLRPVFWTRPEVEENLHFRETVD